MSENVSAIRIGSELASRNSVYRAFKGFSFAAGVTTDLESVSTNRDAAVIKENENLRDNPFSETIRRGFPANHVDMGRAGEQATAGGRRFEAGRRRETGHAACSGSGVRGRNQRTGNLRHRTYPGEGNGHRNVRDFAGPDIHRE